MNMSITINEERLKNTFIELVGVPCPSCDEKQEAELLVKKLQELGMEPQVDRAGEQCGGTTGNVWGFLKGNVPGVLRLFFEAHMDSVAPTTGTHVMEKDGVLYSDGTTRCGCCVGSHAMHHRKRVASRGYPGLLYHRGRDWKLRRALHGQNHDPG